MLVTAVPYSNESVQAAAATVQSTIFAPTALKYVYLTNSTFIKVKNVNVVEGDSGRAFVYTLTIVNKDKKTLDLTDYWFQINSKSGAAFKIKKLDANAKEVVPANSSKDFTYYAEIDANSKLTDLSIQVIKWDFSLPSYQRNIGVISIPTTYNDAAPFNKTQSFKWNNQLLYTKLRKAIVAKDNENQSITFDWVVVNGGTLSLKLAGTKFSVITKSGDVYPIDYDPATTVVPAKGIKTISLSASVPVNVSLQGASLVWYETKEGINYPLPIAKHAIVSSSEQQQIGPKLNFSFSDQVFVGAPSQVIVTPSTDQLNNLEVTYDLTNKGNQGVTIPKLAFEFKAASGSTYPLTNASDAAVTINPGITKSIKIQAEAPLTETSAKGWLLVYEIVKSGDTEKKNLLGKQEMSITGQKNDVYNFGSQAGYTNTNGKYNLSVKDVQRNPWNNEDLLQAKIEVSNNENSADKYLPLPVLTAEVYLDGVLLSKPVQVIPLTEQISVGNKDIASYMVNVKLSNAQKFKNVKVVVKEKIGENSIKMASFMGTSLIGSPTPVQLGTPISTNRDGKASEITVQNVKAYSGKTTDMLYVDLKMANKSLRVDSFGKWIGYFKNKSGLIFPAVIAETPDMISPQGEIATSAYAIIPKNVGFTDFELIVGEGVNDQGYIKPGDTATSFISAGSFNVGINSPAVPTQSLESLDLFPYKLNISHVLAGIVDEKNFEVSFDYNINSELNIEKDLTKHKITLELIDEAGKTYETTYSIDPADNNSLEIGKTVSKEWDVQDNNFFANVPKFKSYKLNIYDVVNDHKRLIGTKSLEWLIRS